MTKENKDTSIETQNEDTTINLPEHITISDSDVERDQRDISVSQEETKNNNTQGVDDTVGDLEPHPKAAEKYAMLKPYVGQDIYFIHKEIDDVAKGTVKNCQDKCKLIEINEKNDTITVSSMYLSPAETKTNSGQSYFGKMIIEHASWMRFYMGIVKAKFDYYMCDKTQHMIIEE